MGASLGGPDKSLPHLPALLSKCVLTVCAGADGIVDRRAFPDSMQVNQHGAMNLLGAPIGPQDYTEDYTRTKRVEKARPLLQALGELPDPQTGLLLLRHCAAYSRMVFALRVTPPQLLAGAASDLTRKSALAWSACALGR